MIRIMKDAESIVRFPEIYNHVSHEYGDVMIVGDHVLRVLMASDDIPHGLKTTEQERFACFSVQHILLTILNDH